MCEGCSLANPWQFLYPIGHLRINKKEKGEITMASRRKLARCVGVVLFVFIVGWISYAFYRDGVGEPTYAEIFLFWVLMGLLYYGQS